ncbi:Thioesterase [Tenacibaculum dicentrarchi]|uniref:Thioesterase n=1 Tax=Tenacibaculum dicentrarchi TaxID=669041 RepID=A0ABM9NZY4_9FLAO|nr:Thioesterase [Tenacibaculum dicentrarchi]
MKFTPRKINLFTLLKLPSAYICGIRVKSIFEEKSTVVVKHRWINQNPFNSMFWAVQGMAAELSTGILVIQAIEASNEKVSMLVTNMNATFTKKATGKIQFSCNDGLLIKQGIQKSIETGEGQTVLVTSEGVNNEGISVSKFEFEWSLKVKSKVI